LICRKGTEIKEYCGRTIPAIVDALTSENERLSSNRSTTAVPDFHNGLASECSLARKDCK
jgi:hypothetical protein